MQLGAVALKNSRRWHSYLRLRFTGWAHDSALEFTAFHAAVLAISSEIFTTKGSESELHAKIQNTQTHTHTNKNRTHKEKDRHVDVKSAGEIQCRTGQTGKHKHADKSEVKTKSRHKMADRTGHTQYVHVNMDQQMWAFCIRSKSCHELIVYTSISQTKI